MMLEDGLSRLGWTAKKQSDTNEFLTMTSSGRKLMRRSSQELYLKLILVSKILASLVCGVILASLSSSLLHSLAIKHVDHGVANVKLDSLAQHVALSQISTLNHVSKRVSEEFLDKAEDDVVVTLQTTANSADDTISEVSLLRSGVTDRQLVSRIAFGSCTSRREIEQSIWREGVIASDPHAWIWAGDIAYMDWPDVNCKENPDQHQCNCTRTWLHNNRQTCLSGDISHAIKRLGMQLQNSDYQEFMQYMCPNARSSPQSPWGDLASCSKPILGTWDDHDYNWQDGDRRLPTKERQKEIFLDAFGVPFDSPRRSEGRGIYWKHTLNEGFDGREIDVLLLDERFHRDSKPCVTRREFCEKVALPDPTKYKHEWCKDFINGGEDGQGACCKKDELIWEGWCKENNNPGDELWEAACNPKSKAYGSSDLAIDMMSGDPVRKDSGLSITSDDGVLCEVLGPEQRSWLQYELHDSNAPLKLIVSGSPAFNNPKDFICSKSLRRRPAVNCTCYDDYDCFRPAQINLLHNLAHAHGCVVIITGDFHFSDIKVLQPGKNNYSDAYESSDLPHPIFQVMASGLTTDTGQKASCDGYRLDKNGLRPGGECSFVSGPAFGMIEVDWEAPEQFTKLQIRDDQGVVKLETVIRLDTCTMV